VSVLELSAAGATKRRGESDHNKQSSRSGYSPFPYEVAETCAALFLRNTECTVDPFAGWGERGAAMARHSKKYVGFDISNEAIAHAKSVHGVSNVLADSRTVNVPEHDGLLTCPPYWDLEKYAGNDGLDRCRSWDQFLDQYRSVLDRFASCAMSGSTYCIMTGDWRSEGVYYDLTFQTEKIMSHLGFKPFDKVVVSRLSISKIKIMLPQAKRLGYTVKVHEMLSVFKKP
jgi:DNA modification methylase